MKSKNMIPVKYQYYLQALARAHSPTQRKKLISIADPQIIKIICEIALNILKGNVHLTNKQLTKLKPYRNTIRKLADSRKKIEIKRKLLYRQKGGFLPFLIPIISSLAGGLLGSIFKKSR